MDSHRSSVPEVVLISGPCDVMGGQQSAPMGRPPMARPNGVAAVDAAPIRKGFGGSPGPAGAGAPRRPMPDELELERRFNEVLVQMDLPPERAKLLRGFDNAKKWDIICDQEQVHARDLPSTYLSKIRTYMDPSAPRSSKKIRSLGDSTSTQVLRNLEISLRTNNIEWVREFLGPENHGLDVLVDYLSERLLVMRHMLRLEVASDGMGNKSATLSSTSSSLTAKGSTLKKQNSGGLDIEGPRLSKMMRNSTKLKMGDTTDDIHVCIMCLRAIMNNKYGFNMVIQHKRAINCIALSLMHRKLRTKALVLELLAAICLVKGGHSIILTAFDNFKQELGETHRFETLMRYFSNPESFQIEFMVACMQFINIVVHSVDDMNFRVALQFEFTSLGLDECLEKLRRHESEELSVQISAYTDNEFDVAALMEEADTKATAIERVHELEEELGKVNELLQELEVDAMTKQVEFENKIEDLKRERDQILEKTQQVENEYSTLRKTVTSKEEDSKRRQSMLEEKIRDLEKKLSNSSSSISSAGSVPASTTTAAAPAPAPPPPPPPAIAAPPPPPPPGAPPPPKAPGAPPPPPLGKTDPNLTIRRTFQTTYKLPTVHWVALKPNDTKDTIWYVMDDTKLMKDIDFATFEENFKLSPQPISVKDRAAHGSASEADGNHVSPPKKAQHESLMEHTRLKNMAICRRKLPPIPIPDLIRAINALDINILSMDTVELLQRMVPLDAEIKAYRDYNTAKKDVENLTEEDKVMRQFSCVERFGTKLQIMAFMTNLEENLKMVRPQINAIMLASKSLRQSKKMKRVLELILAFGNYMNSTKKGPCYGFKLQSLDSLTITKSSDKKMHLVHYLVDFVQKNYPDVKNFDSELTCMEKASQFSIENVMTDLRELEKGMDITTKELDHRQGTPNAKDKSKVVQNEALKEFVDSAQQQLRQLRQEADRAEALFKECVEYFGENPKMMDANTFFGYFVRFVALWKTSEAENEKRAKLQKAALEAEKAKAQENDEVERRNAANAQRRNLQSQLISEFKQRAHPSGSGGSAATAKTSHIRQDEVRDGTLEDIILGLKNEPYRANVSGDGMRKSFRRQRSDRNSYMLTNESEAL